MAWWNDKEDFANAVYDTLDPVYGDGGVLEPVTVIVDPDRTVKDEYVDPIVKEGTAYVEDIVEEYVDPIVTEVYDDSKQLIKAAAIIGGLYLLLK